MGQDLTLDAFEEEVTAFLDGNAERRASEADTRFVWGEGDDSVAILEDNDPDEERRQLAAAKQWRAARFDAGLGYITWR